MIVSGLNKTGIDRARKIAFQIARRYVTTTIKSCHEHSDECEIFEKYHPEHGTAGGGGEYDVQLGFGWTNGVLIDFIVLYGDDLIEKEELEL